MQTFAPLAKNADKRRLELTKQITFASLKAVSGRENATVKHLFQMADFELYVYSKE